MFKSKEADIPLRRSELITPNGVGAITTNSDGINMITGALDYWYETAEDIDIKDFVIKENRLKSIFKVNSFRLPPDYRTASSYSKKMQEYNLNIEIPMLRFPNYYYCSHCKTMSKQSAFNKDSRLKCIHCDNKFARLIQVPLIVACKNGHLDDFPWMEWVHKDLNPTCTGPLKLMSTGGATLSTMKVVCTVCKVKRGLDGLTTRDSKKLHESLTDNGKYKCTARKPWFGSKSGDVSCDCIPQPILKNATNAYYPQVLNAIYIPIINNEEIIKILELFAEPIIDKKITRYTGKFPQDELIKELRDEDFPDKLACFSFESLREALNIYSSNGEIEESDESLNLKLEEYNYLASSTIFDKSDKLKVIPEYNSIDDDSLLKKFGLSKINLVPKLIETRVLYGFNRLTEPPALSTNQDGIIEKGKQQLFIETEKHNWLPAYQVYGEGIYLEFDHQLLKNWEETYCNSKRFQKLYERISNAKNNGIDVKDDVTPRYVLLHTLAHLFIQETVLSSGYSSSSLKERIFYGPNPNEDKHMNGFLIYTAAGDSEGTMGGLVRLGKKESIKNILEKVIEKARWCSSDPICNEIGMDKGQGRDYLNGAACHNCTYTSEISCEEFNKYLDRGFITSYETYDDYCSFFDFLKLINKDT